MTPHFFMAIAMIVYFAFGFGGKHDMMHHSNMQNHDSHFVGDSTKTSKEKMNHHNHEKKDDHKDHELKDDAKKDSTEMKAWNTVCPVLGNEVDGETELVEYNGKYYGFCCPGCDTKFKKNPEKYSKNLSEDGTEFIKK